VEFEVRQWVWLRLLHCLIASLNVKGRDKLDLIFYGPFQVLEHVGNVVYKLNLSVGASLHDVFHVGLLKKFYGDPPLETVALPPIRHDRACLEMTTGIKSGLTRGRQEILVQF
jgi:hypothetical protein